MAAAAAAAALGDGLALPSGVGIGGGGGGGGGTHNKVVNFSTFLAPPPSLGHSSVAKLFSPHSRCL